MKILLVITGLGMGGAERQICDLADGLTSRGHNVKIAYLLKPVVLMPKSNEIELVWLKGGRSFLSIVKALFHLVKVVHCMKPDVIHSHMFHANILSRLSKLFYLKSRMISTAHNVSEGGRLRMFIYRITNFLTDEFTNVSQEAVESFENKKAVTKGTMLVTHNGIDTSYFSFCDVERHRLREAYGLEGKKVFISIGRFHEQKDYPNLINAFNDFSIGKSDVHLLIVGDGKLRSLIEDIIKDKNLHHSITILGLRNDIPELLSASDIFVLPSAWEGFGLVVAEAMACERVIIATDCGGVAEVLGEEGFLIEPKNSNSLQLAMSNAYSLPLHKRKELGIASRLRVMEKYSINSAVDRWLRIYEENES